MNFLKLLAIIIIHLVLLAFGIAILILLGAMYWPDWLTTVLGFCLGFGATIASLSIVERLWDW